MDSKDFKKIILDKLTAILKPLGFKKNGNTFRFSNGELTYSIGFQSSKYSTSKILEMTINTGIFSVPLQKLIEKFISSNPEDHYRERIGFYLDNRHDKWWVIENNEAASLAANEIAAIIIDKVLPEFSTIKATNDLIEIWKQDRCPGLTDYQRKGYLELWKKAATAN